MKIGIITLGCKVNQYESDAIGQELTKMGHQVVTKLEPADLYILNTCAVTSIAEKKSRTNLAKMQKLNPNAKIIVCGCASQNNAQQFLKHKNVSVVLGTSGKNKIANPIAASLVGEFCIMRQTAFVCCHPSCADHSRTVSLSSFSTASGSLNSWFCVHSSRFAMASARLIRL